MRAIRLLHASDVLLTESQITGALARAGMDLGRVRAMPYGAIRWRGETDKTGTEWITPIAPVVRAELEDYLRQNPRVGEAWLLPYPRLEAQPVGETTLHEWYYQAENLAELPKMERGAFHAYRRLWATERKHLPAADAAEAGGWRSVETMTRIYVHSDPDTVLRAVIGAQ